MIQNDGNIMQQSRSASIPFITRECVKSLNFIRGSEQLCRQWGIHKPREGDAEIGLTCMHGLLANVACRWDGDSSITHSDTCAGP